MPTTTSKLSISLPNDLLMRADRVLARRGEGRSALLARVLDEAVRAAEEHEIDAEYERAYGEQAETDEEKAVHTTMDRLAGDYLADVRREEREAGLEPPTR